MPVFGEGVEALARLSSRSTSMPETVTLSAPLGADGTSVTFTTGFLTTGRRVKHWTQVTEQPALFLRRIGSR
jgi:hypothetical protein